MTKEKSMWFVSYTKRFIAGKISHLNITLPVGTHPIEWMMRENVKGSSLGGESYRVCVLWYTDLTHNEVELVERLEGELKRSLS
jgi:hypothetical protein